MDKLDDILRQRASAYGDFKENTEIVFYVLQILHKYDNYHHLPIVTGKLP